MSDVLLRRADVEFLLFDWLQLDAVLRREPYAEHSRDTVMAVLDLTEKLAADAFMPHYKACDSTEPTLDADGVHVLPAIGDALRQYAELGLFSASFPADLGGFGLPYMVTATCYAWFTAANASTSAYIMLTGANARLIATFGNSAQVDTFARPQIEGRWFGTMCLSEPQATQYTTHGDLWDYIYDRYRAAQPGGVFLPLTLELGASAWLRKSLRFLDKSAFFHPLEPRRTKRVLRRHIPLFEFLLRAVYSWERWARLSPQCRATETLRASALWE